MQDLQTGNLVPLSGLAFEEFKARIPLIESQKQIEELLQSAKDQAIPDRSRQGPVFAVGEILEIKGGKFRVHAITEKRIYLDSLPA